MSPYAYDFEAAWNYLLSIKLGDECRGFEKFFSNGTVEDPDSLLNCDVEVEWTPKRAAAYLLAVAQPKGVFALYCDYDFYQEIDTKRLKEAKAAFKQVLDDILALKDKRWL